MNRIRLATNEEVEKIKPVSDLDENCLVFALDGHNGVGLAVRRLCQEIDPMVTPEDWNTKLKAMFVRDLETVMAAQGVKYYYFNVAADDEQWQSVVKNWGAEQVSIAPELRFKRTL
jgi:hypothetical protein